MIKETPNKTSAYRVSHFRSIIMTSVVQIRKLPLREVKGLAGEHTAHRLQSWDPDLTFATPRLLFFLESFLSQTVPRIFLSSRGCEANSEEWNVWHSWTSLTPPEAPGGSWFMCRKSVPSASLPQPASRLPKPARCLRVRRTYLPSSSVLWYTRFLSLVFPLPRKLLRLLDEPDQMSP